jgi:hypothetical protein
VGGIYIYVATEVLYSTSEFSTSKHEGRTALASSDWCADSGGCSDNDTEEDGEDTREGLHARTSTALELSNEFLPIQPNLQYISQNPLTRPLEQSEQASKRAQSSAHLHSPFRWSKGIRSDKEANGRPPLAALQLAHPGLPK